jgi:hypothetical protein
MDRDIQSSVSKEIRLLESQKSQEDICNKSDCPEKALRMLQIRALG